MFNYFAMDHSTKDVIREIIFETDESQKPEFTCYDDVQKALAAALTSKQYELFETIYFRENRLYQVWKWVERANLHVMFSLFYHFADETEFLFRVWEKDTRQKTLKIVQVESRLRIISGGIQTFGITIAMLAYYTDHVKMIELTNTRQYLYEPNNCGVNAIGFVIFHANGPTQVRNFLENEITQPPSTDGRIKMHFATKSSVVYELALNGADLFCGPEHASDTYHPWASKILFIANQIPIDMESERSGLSVYLCSLPDEYDVLFKFAKMGMVTRISPFNETLSLLLRDIFDRFVIDIYAELIYDKTDTDDCAIIKQDTRLMTLDEQNEYFFKMGRNIAFICKFDGILAHRVEYAMDTQFQAIRDGLDANRDWDDLKKLPCEIIYQIFRTKFYGLDRLFPKNAFNDKYSLMIHQLDTILQQSHSHKRPRLSDE